jgi:hypothetical protein
MTFPLHPCRTGKLTKPEGTSWKKLREVFEFYQLPDMALPLSTRAKLASGCVLEDLVESTIAPEIEVAARNNIANRLLLTLSKTTWPWSTGGNELLQAWQFPKCLEQRLLVVPH